MRKSFLSVPESNTIVDSPSRNIPRVFIITGAPCTGKTTIARRLAKRFQLALFTKDDIKTRLFDVLGWSDREWSSRLSRATSELLFYLLEENLLAGTAMAVESNFKPERHNSRFAELGQKYRFLPVQIFLTANPNVIEERFRRRARDGERHPGHRDDLLLDEIGASLRNGTYAPLDVDGPLISLDTTSRSAEDAVSFLLPRLASHLCDRARARRENPRD